MTIITNKRKEIGQRKSFSSTVVQKFNIMYNRTTARPGPKKISPERAKSLSKWTPEDKQSAWELSGQFEGDIILVANQRNGLIDERYRWPNKTLIYEFSPNINDTDKQIIISALGQYTANTCIQHREKRDSDDDYIYVTNLNEGCWSYVGRLGGRQDLNLQPGGCMRVGTIVHEFLHALGFYHQQSATERDDYVTIMWENIEDGHEHNFDKYSSDVITNFGTTYDYGSVMHYSAYAFSKNGEMTIVTKV
jgi:hypothetical protein